MKRDNIIYLIALVCSTMLLSSCVGHIPHPPSYADFIENEIPLDLEGDLTSFLNNKEKFDDALRFTAAEMTYIKETRDPHLIVGAALQGRSYNFDCIPDEGIQKVESTATAKRREFLEFASTIEDPKGLATVSLINEYLEVISSQHRDASVDSRLREHIINLSKQKSNNALNNYLYAILMHKEGHNNEALLQIRKGNQKSYFNSFSKQRYEATVKAAEYIGYSKFTARLYAMQEFVPLEIYSKLNSLCRGLISDEKRERMREACFSMGEKMEKASLTNIETLLSLMIESMALGDKPIDLKRRVIIDKKRKAMRLNEEFLTYSDLSEDIWLKYFDIFFEKGEQAARGHIKSFLKRE